jgi:hypothetical protein
MTRAVCAHPGSLRGTAGVLGAAVVEPGRGRARDARGNTRAIMSRPPTVPAAESHPTRTEATMPSPQTVFETTSDPRVARPGWIAGRSPAPPRAMPCRRPGPIP